MRAIIALFLSVVLALGSVSMAVAHGQMPMGATITICTEGGTSDITLDASGNPVSPGMHLCPDCLSASAAALPDAGGTLPEPVATSRPAVFATPVSLLPRQSPHTPLARGPPALFV